MDRRRFLAAGGALSVGILGGWACGAPDSTDGVRDPTSGVPGEGAGAGSTSGADGGDGAGSAERPESVEPSLDRGGLPPRVVGLRSLGGAFRFDPAGLLIEPGRAVHWLNLGDFHTVTAFHPDNAHLIPTEVPLRMPEGAASYHSGMLGLTAGTQFSHRFETEGVYDYFCQPHYSFGRGGRIIVGRPVDGPALERPDDDLLEVARTNMPSVEAITGPGGARLEWMSRVNGILYWIANGGDGAAVAETVAGRATRDDALLDWLGSDRRSALERALSEMVEEANGSADYEVLVRRADDVKKVLRGGGESA